MRNFQAHKNNPDAKDPRKLYIETRAGQMLV